MGVVALKAFLRRQFDVLSRKPSGPAYGKTECKVYLNPQIPATMSGSHDEKPSRFLKVQVESTSWGFTSPTLTTCDLAHRGLRCHERVGVSCSSLLCSCVSLCMFTGTCLYLLYLCVRSRACISVCVCEGSLCFQSSSDCRVFGQSP